MRWWVGGRSRVPYLRLILVGNVASYFCLSFSLYMMREVWLPRSGLWATGWVASASLTTSAFGQLCVHASASVCDTP